MAVLLADRFLGVRRQTLPVADAHGDLPGGAWAALSGPWPGRAEEGDDVPAGEIGGRVWLMGVDPRGWPVRRGDLIVDPGEGMEWLVTTARLICNNADPVVDYVRVEAHLREGDSTRP